MLACSLESKRQPASRMEIEHENENRESRKSFFFIAMMDFEASVQMKICKQVSLTNSAMMKEKIENRKILRC